ncbi:hypothetical protein GYMLUDRAFT_857237 [Collybiopsis luxurians FD-317 M1]|nr:hypothetical protein GYMLUDRAFT_857237 [Collybiopsis luxurians FD-317 M1]
MWIPVFYSNQISSPGCLFNPPSASELVCYSLASLYLIGSPSPLKCIPLISIGIRQALESGLHCAKSEGRRWTSDDEQRKRAFWVLHSLDRLTAGFLGRPFALHEEDFDADMPLEVDDEYWEGGEFTQPNGKPSVITAFICYLRLCEILEVALRALYSNKKSQLILGLAGQSWQKRIVSELDSAMNKWMSELPDHLRPGLQDDGTIFAQQSVFLRTAYFNLQIYIHHLFLNKASPLANFSLSICTTAARSCASILDNNLNTNTATSLPHTQFASFHAALVLLFNLWHSKRIGLKVSPRRDLEYIDKLLGVLASCESRWALPGRYC